MTTGPAGLPFPLPGMDDDVDHDEDRVQAPEDADRNEPRLAAALGPSLQVHPHGASDHRHHHQAEDEGTGRTHDSDSGDIRAIERRPSSRGLLTGPRNAVYRE